MGLTTSNRYRRVYDRLISLITDTQPTADDLDAAKPVRASLGWRAWVLILSISIATCCFKLGDTRTLTEHEIMVAGGAKQMALDHDWLFPKIGNRLWLEKPPLLHWLVVVSAKLLGGFSEAAVRLPSVLAGLGVVVVMTMLSLRMVWSARSHFHGAAANNHGLLHHLCPFGRGGDVVGLHCRSRALCFCALALHRWRVAATASARGAAVLGTCRSE